MPSLIQSDLIRLGTPHAEITISAFITVSCRRSSEVSLQTEVTEVEYLERRFFIGKPATLPLPMAAMCLFLKALVEPNISSNIARTPRGVHEMKWGTFCHVAKALTFIGCRPSTSFYGPISFITFKVPKWSGRGIWTKIPLILSSCLSSWTFLMSSDSVTEFGSLKPISPIPTSSHALIYCLIYLFWAGDSPTRICPSIGLHGLQSCLGLIIYFCIILRLRSRRTFLASLLPSKILSDKWRILLLIIQLKYVIFKSLF